jgi:hypothetical protein
VFGRGGEEADIQAPMFGKEREEERAASRVVEGKSRHNSFIESNNSKLQKLVKLNPWCEISL